MKRLLVVFVLVAAGLVLAPATPTDAYHNPCRGYIGPAELGVEGFAVDLPGGPLGTFYLDVRYVAEDTAHLYSFWLYQETNEMRGLQRGYASDWICIPEDPICNHYTDPCDESLEPDTLIL